MPKRSNKRDPDISETGGGVAAAVAQDLELTVEQAEEGVKKAAHKAAVALGLSSGEKPAKPFKPSSNTFRTYEADRAFAIVQAQTQTLVSLWQLSFLVILSFVKNPDPDASPRRIIQIGV
jgi:hypothetical protein